MKNKVLAMFLAVCLISGSAAVPGNVSSASTESGVQEARVAAEGDAVEMDWEWEVLEDETVAVTEYKGTGTEVVIPDTIEGKAVTSVGAETFSWCAELKQVTIPDSVTEIGRAAFYACTGLEQITIPEGVTTIGDSAFSMCSRLKAVSLPDSVTLIGDAAFSFCESLESIVLPENLTAIGEEAFAFCWEGSAAGETETGLSSIMIPAKVTSIGKGAFSGCYKLRQIEVAEGNGSYASVDGVLFNKAKTELAAYPVGKGLTKYEVPEGVQRIGAGAFQSGSNLSEVILPSTLREIGERGFEFVSLKDIRLPEGLKKIGNYAFSNVSFTEITVPSSVTDIGVGAFEGIFLTAIHVDAANTSYVSEDGVLFNKAKTALIAYPSGREEEVYIVPASVTEIGSRAFFNAQNLTIVLVAKQVARIKGAAFSMDFLKELTILNPQCVIDEMDAEGEPCYTISQETKIRGHENSTAQTYAVKNENPFEAIPEVCGHSYLEQITTQATCTQKGIKTFTCKNCGESHTEELPLANHNNQTQIQQASPGKNGSIANKCSVCGKVSASQPIMAPAAVSLSKTSVIYNGKARNVTVTVKDTVGKVIPAANYSVGISNNTNVGEAVVTVTFKGNYSGSMKNTFRILPKGTAISKATAKSKGFALKWKKQSNQTTGYEIQYSTNSKFKGKTTKIVKVKKNKTTSKNISRLKARKRYYVRIRTYKAVKINGKNIMLYSGWSKVKKVTTKK